MVRILVRVAMFLAGLILAALGFLMSWNTGDPLAIAFNVGAVVLVVSLVRLPVERTRRAMQRWLWLLPLGGYFASSFVITIFWNEHGTQRFFELVSQIIPILVLALIVELRLLTPPVSHVSGQLAVGVLTLLLLSLGEFYSLAVVVSRTPSEEAFTTATSALVAAPVGLLVGALALPKDSYSTPHPEKGFD